MSGELADPRELLRAGYVVVRERGAGWVLGLHGELVGDGHPSEHAAWADAAEHYREQHPDPEWCPRCGDTGTCPECVGG